MFSKRSVLFCEIATAIHVRNEQVQYTASAVEGTLKG